jgi:Cu2+-exporting ATPase
METALFSDDAGAARQAARWSALDERAEWESFSRPLPGQPGLWESYLAIGGMYCAACSLTVEEVLQRLPGVDSVQVNGASAVARLTWSPGQGRPSAWLAALQRAGYGALPAGDMLAAAPRVHAQRMMLWRWLVAGFCMMQVMMYAFPAYIAEPGDISLEAQGLLRWASWVLTLPVVLFSCWPFFSSALRDLRNRRVGMDVPVALGILIAFGASSAATFDPASLWGGEVWYDSVTMFVFFLLSGRLLEQRLRDRTAGSLEALMRSLPESVERQDAEGIFQRVAVRRLVPGDLVRLLPGDVVPADGRVEAGESEVDEALLTGESTPLHRRTGSRVIAGSHNLSGMLQVRVEQVGAQTRYAGMVALMEQASVQKPRLARIADRIAGPFVILVLMASAAAALWWWPTDPVHAISVAVAVLIVTCPCALSLATPAATLAAAGALARRGVLVRRLEALESCATANTVVFDKTGTLTEDRMTVKVGQTREGVDPGQAIQLAAALAMYSLHPLSRAIVQAAGVGVPGSASGITEIPGQGIVGQVSSGAGKSHALRLGSAAFCDAIAQAQASGMPRVYLADEEGWLASFEMVEVLRSDAKVAVDALHAQGLEVQLLSGDVQDAVTLLASRVGIRHAHGLCTPEDKLAHVRALQGDGRQVVMVGDGMNDGPVLACANVSIAMGQAVPLAQAKADFIIPGARLPAVAALLRHARRTRAVVRQNLSWAALYNAVCVPLAVLGFMPPWLAGLGMAASSLLVVVNSARLARLSDEV